MFIHWIQKEFWGKDMNHLRSTSNCIIFASSFLKLIPYLFKIFSSPLEKFLRNSWVSVPESLKQ